MFDELFTECQPNLDKKFQKQIKLTKATRNTESECATQRALCNVLQ